MNFRNPLAGSLSAVSTTRVCTNCTQRVRVRELSSATPRPLGKRLRLLQLIDGWTPPRLLLPRRLCPTLLLQLLNVGAAVWATAGSSSGSAPGGVFFERLRLAPASSTAEGWERRSRVWGGCYLGNIYYVLYLPGGGLLPPTPFTILLLLLLLLLITIIINIGSGCDARPEYTCRDAYMYFMYSVCI